jgi:hypothetical protein
MTYYMIKTGPEHHSGERPWMRLATTTMVNTLNVGQRCLYEATTTDEEALEDALQADDDVLEFTAFAVGDRVEGGRRGTEDHDTGRIDSIDGSTAWVSWDSLVRTRADLRALRHESERS